LRSRAGRPRTEPGAARAAAPRAAGRPPVTAWPCGGSEPVA
jgi:hypothetical protein